MSAVIGRPTCGGSLNGRQRHFFPFVRNSRPGGARGGGTNPKNFPLEVYPRPRLNPCSPKGRGRKTTFFIAARGPQHAARRPQHRCGPRVTRAALRNFAGHITMQIFGPSLGHISWRRGPHMARGPHFLHHCAIVSLPKTDWPYLHDSMKFNFCRHQWPIILCTYSQIEAAKKRKLRYALM